MASLYEYLLEQQEFVKRDMAALLENQSDSYFKQRFADRLAKLMAIQHMIEHKDYGDRSYKDETYADSAIQSNILTVINDRKKLLSDRSQFALRLSKKDLVHIACGENGTAEDLKENDIKTEDIKARFLQQTGRNGILTEDEQRPDHYWLGQMETQVREGREKAFTQGEISEEDAKYHLATAIALTQISYDRKESLEQLQSKLEERRKEIMNGTAFQRATEGKNGAEIAAICGKLDPENKTFGSYGKDELNQAYQNAVVTRSMDIVLGRMHDSLKKGKFNLKNARYRLAAALMYNDVLNGKIKVEKVPINLDDWKDTEKERNKLVNDPSFNWIEKMSREDFVAMCGKYNNETKEYTPYSKDVIFANFNAERDKYFEQQRQKEEAEKKAAEEAKLKEAQEKAAQEQPEQQAEWPRERLQQVDLTPHMAWRMMYGDEQQAEEQPKVEEQPKPFDSAEYIDSWQSYFARELKRQLTRDSGYHPAHVVSALTQLHALQEMKESGYVGKSRKQIEDEADFRASLMKNKEYAVATFGISTSQEDMAKLFGKTEEGVYQLNPVDQVLKTFNESVQQRKREREQNIQRWNKMDSLCTQALNSEGEERRTAVATLVAMQRIYYGEKDANKTSTNLKKISDEQRVEKLAKFMLQDKAFQEIADSDRLNPYLEKRDLENVADEVQQFRNARTKEAAQEKAGKTDRENVLRAREEAERENALSDEVVAGLNMTETGDQLYSEIGKLYEPLSAAYGKEWWGEVEKAQHYFVDYEGSGQFKENLGKLEQFLDTKLSDGKTIGQFAKEERLLGGNFEKLMDHANEITSPTKTAASWIEEQKADLANRIRSNQKGDNYPAADIARIFAARELSNSVRGKKSTLGESISDYKINKRAAEIMANKSFKDFAAKLSKGENLSKVEAIFTKKFSHGGELDDMFRDYLTKRPAGELENDPKLKRWMPTVKQRVEFLQSEAAKVQKKNETPYKEAAEILLLRQAAEVKRGGKGLEANVPVIGEKGASSLQASVENYTNDAKFKEAFNQPDVKKYILSGHGGEMAERYNKQPEAKKIEQKNDQQLGK